MKDAQELLEYIIKTICNDSEKVRVETSIDERGSLLTVYVQEAEAGRLIGKKGATANAIRDILRSLGGKNNAAYSLKIEVEKEGQI